LCRPTCQASVRVQNGAAVLRPPGPTTTPSAVRRIRATATPISAPTNNVDQTPATHPSPDAAGTQTGLEGSAFLLRLTRCRCPTLSSGDTQGCDPTLIVRNALFAHRPRSAAQSGQSVEQVPEGAHVVTVAMHDVRRHFGQISLLCEGRRPSSTRPQEHQRPSTRRR